MQLYIVEGNWGRKLGIVAFKQIILKKLCGLQVDFSELANSLNCVGIEVRYRLPCASLDFFSIFAPRPLAGGLAALQADRLLLAGHSILGAECVREAPSRAVWVNVKRL